MPRLHVVLTDPQMRALKAEAKRTGLTLAELIRRAVDAHLAKEK